MNRWRSLYGGLVFNADFICQRKINMCFRTKSSIFAVRNYDFLFKPFKKLVKNEN